MKSTKIVTITVVLISVIGLPLLVYPAISDYINSTAQSRTITTYTDGLAHLNADKCARLVSEAQEYNESLANRTRTYHLNEDQAKKYPEMLKTSDSEVMGYLEIPKINCFLPICRRTDEVGSAIVADHVEWSSLPVGGTSSHCVISGSRGFPSSKLFTDLDQLEIGDIFFVRVLNLILTYEVDQILIVEADDVSALAIEPGKDYCSLTASIPYGLNSRRVLVRGERIENTEEANSVQATSNTIQFVPLIIAMLIVLPALILLLIPMFKKKQEA